MKKTLKKANPVLLRKLVASAFEEGIIAPSILSSDFSCLGSELKSVESAGAKWIHVDVMDGHFVPNLTIGPVVVEKIRPRTKSLIDCHLMVSDPEKWIEGFAAAGADCITIHAEASNHLHRLLQKIKSLGCMAGVSVNPGSPLTALEPVLDETDLVLVMSVNPGFGGQKFIPTALEKIHRLVALRGSRKFLIQVDGGINTETIGSARAAGADVFVSGSAIFDSKNRNKSFRAIQKKMEESN